MNARGIIENLKARKFQIVEVSTYAVLASCLIGQVFFLQGQIAASNVAMIGLGIIFGSMATMLATPLSRRLSKPDSFDLAEVFPLKKHDVHHRPTSDEQQAA